jgi:hypothetical protein
MDISLYQHNNTSRYYDYLNHNKNIFEKINMEFNKLNFSKKDNNWELYYKIHDEQFNLYNEYLHEQQEKDNMIIKSRNIETTNKIKELLSNLENIVYNEYYKYPYCSDCNQCSNENLIRDKCIKSLEEILTESEKNKLFGYGCSTCNLPICNFYI